MSFCSYTCQASNKLSACLSSLWTFGWMPSECQVRLPKHAKSSWSIHPLRPIIHRDKGAAQIDGTSGYFDFAHLLHSNWGDDGCRICTGKPDTSRRLYFDFPGLWIELSSEPAVGFVWNPCHCRYAPLITCWSTSSRSCPRFRCSGSWGRKNIQRPGHLCRSGSLQLQILDSHWSKNMTHLHLWNPLLMSSHTTDPLAATSQSDHLKRAGRRAKATRTRLETMLDHSSGKSWFVAG